MAERLTMEEIVKDRDGSIRFLQNSLMEFGVDLDHYTTKRALLPDKPSNSRERRRLEETIRMVRAGINSAAKQLVDLEPEIRYEPEGVLKILPVIEEPSAMYFVDSNAMRILVLAPTAAIARTAVKKMVDRARDGNWDPKMCRCLQKYVDGKPIKVRGVFFVCDLAEAVRSG